MSAPYASTLSSVESQERAELERAQATRNLLAFQDAILAAGSFDAEDIIEAICCGSLRLCDIERQHDGQWLVYDWENWPRHKGWTTATDGREALNKAMHGRKFLKQIV